MMHIGVLQTDSVLPEFQGEHGDYPQMFETLFGEVDPQLRFTSYNVQLAAPENIECDAYVITGSRHSVYDDLPWIAPLVKFLGDVLAARRRIIGVCFGHQLMAHFFGGRVAPAVAGWAVGVHRSEVIRRCSWMPDDASGFALLSSHKDQVVELPEGAELYLSNDFCPIAGFTMGREVITVQSHPEFHKPYAADLMKHRREILGEALYQSGIESLSVDTNATTMARWLLAFAQGRT